MAVPALAGDTLTIAAGAGYKKLVVALSTEYTKRTGADLRQIYGNMGQVTAQAEQSGVVDLVIGDKGYLDKTSLPFAAEYPIGKGKLILAVAKGVTLALPDEGAILDSATAKALLTDPVVTRIALPDKKKAIYGRAATQFLASAGLSGTVQSKLLMVGTVPQVSAYLVSGEVDLGFINLTDALTIKDKVARLIPVDESLYKPILIAAKSLKGCPDPATAKAFGEFLATDAARAIAKTHGL
jgi:molybdate transport system substrate-binding protein